MVLKHVNKVAPTTLRTPKGPAPPSLGPGGLPGAAVGPVVRHGRAGMGAALGLQLLGPSGSDPDLHPEVSVNARPCGLVVRQRLWV